MCNNDTHLFSLHIPGFIQKQGSNNSQTDPNSRFKVVLHSDQTHSKKQQNSRRLTLISGTIDQCSTLVSDKQIELQTQQDAYSKSLALVFQNYEEIEIDEIWNHPKFKNKFYRTFILTKLCRHYHKKYSIISFSRNNLMFQQLAKINQKCNCQYRMLLGFFPKRQIIQLYFQNPKNLDIKDFKRNHKILIKKSLISRYLKIIFQLRKFQNKCNQIPIFYTKLYSMAHFQLQKHRLVEIVDTCQNRTFAEEIQCLRRLEEDPNEALYRGLRTNPVAGIPADANDLDLRIKVYGSNSKEVSQPPGFCALFWEALEDFTMRILIVASFLSIAIEVGTAKPDHRSTAWIEGFAVLMAVIICATVTAANDYQKERQFIKLNSVADSRKRSTVIRGGKVQDLHQDDLLVGDLVVINEGMEVPADGYLIQASDIQTDQSAMTGETDPIHKNIFSKCEQKQLELVENGQKNKSGKHDVPSPIMMSGTRVLSGQGKMIVLVVGDQSCIGKVKSLLVESQPSPTPLQMKLEKLAQDIGKFGLYSAIIIVVIMLIRFAIEKGISRQWNTSVDVVQILNFFILGITVIVVAIPEGLPLSVTLSLAFSVKKMLLDNNLVRKMEACETMGGANTICSDKTGTLTMNKMFLTTIWNGKKIRVPYEQQKIDHKSIMQTSLYDLLILSICINSSALLRPEPKGSSTELALLKFIQKTGARYQDFRQKYPTIFKFPFSSKRKRMSSVVNWKGSNVLLVKGASQMILECCDTWYNQQSNQFETLTPEVKSTIEEQIIKMASQSLRTLCLAYKQVQPQFSEQKDSNGVYDIEKSGLVLIAIVGVKDVPRPEVPDAIVRCKKAGIKVRMVTGDNIITAKAIAAQVGIITPQEQHIAMEGPQFTKLVGGVICKGCKISVCDCERDPKIAEKKGKQLRIDVIQNMEVFEKIVPKLSVLARSRPQDKYALVTGLLRMDNVVAVTGDGTNDAPALYKADVGFAMGIAGTQVARQASSIILLDDNFNSIVKAVIWGRNIYDSIKKFVQFQLTVNIVAVGITLIGAALLKQAIMKPIQMLWINLIMDTLASLALATQPPSEELLDRHPHKRDEYIISKKMFKHIIGQAIYQFTVMIILTFLADRFLIEYADGFDTAYPNNLNCKYNSEGFARSGRMIFVDGTSDYETCYNEIHVFSRHFTFIFNTFVMMQVFNFINSRKLHDEINVFGGIFKNWMFLVIIIGILILQIVIVTFGSIAFGVYAYYGLRIEHWLISIGFGAIGLIVNLLLKTLNEDKMCVGVGNKEVEVEAEKGNIALNMKRRSSAFVRGLQKNHFVAASN